MAWVRSSFKPNLRYLVQAWRKRKPNELSRCIGLRILKSPTFGKKHRRLLTRYAKTPQQVWVLDLTQLASMDPTGSNYRPGCFFAIPNSPTLLKMGTPTRPVQAVQKYTGGR